MWCESSHITAGRRRFAVLSQQSRLLTLPAEIRLTIYEFVFADSWIRVVTKKKQKEKGWNWRNIRRLRNCIRHQILLTCRQCYQEARGLWYSSTIWDFDTLTVRPFLDAANIRPYLSYIRFVILRNVHDLTQLQPGLLPSLRYVVASVVNAVPWHDEEKFQNLDAEQTIRAAKNRLFREKGVKTRICDYLYHDGVFQKSPRKKSFCLHFFFANEYHQLDLQGNLISSTWRFLLDLDTNTVEKHVVGPVSIPLVGFTLPWRRNDDPGD